MEQKLEETFNQGVQAHQDGKLQDAEKFYRIVLTDSPRHPHANNNLGVLAMQVGNPTAGLPFLKAAFQTDTKNSEFFGNYINCLVASGLLQEAQRILEIGKSSGASEASLLSAQASLKAARLADLAKNENKIQNVKKIDAEFVPDSIEPTSYEISELLSLYASCNVVDAELLAFSMTQKHPNHPFAWKVLGAIYLQTGRLMQAYETMKRAVKLSPTDPEIHNNFSNTLRELGLLDKAEASCREAIRLKPSIAQPYSNLGNVLKDLGRYAEAETLLREAIRLKDNYADAHCNLARVIQETGGLAEAVSCYREAIRLSPDNLVYRDNLLFAVNYDDQLSAEDVYKEYENYHSAISRIIGGFKYSHVGRAIGKSGKIRLGYSSPDFTGHSVHLFIEPILKNHDRSRFEIYAYANVKVPDAHTERMKGYFDSWVDVCAMSDEGIAQRIFDDQIDILVDLAGHTVGNRLPVFARCPAPIQVGLLLGAGYTTGLKEIDYIIGDEYITPRGSEPYFSEQIWRVPAPQFCYQPHAENIPEVNELPALVKGYLTFGSLSRTVRINDRLLKVWGSILAKTPNSRLRLDQQLFIDENTRNIFMDRLERLGISRDRVELTCSRPHWRAYHDIDISLDCFPHNAGTTTFDSLWMGVPVLTKLDRPSVGRFGVSILEPLGLSNWVAETEEVYINKAVAFARNLEELVFLRSTLRDRLAKSSLMKPDELASKIEAAYLGMVEER
jgi:predicted O-linked N-acetylglucosamine transferase (SPINDLY family)